MQQLFHPGVKGNIRENQKIPAFWIELSPKSRIGNQLSEFIATNSAGRTYDIVYYLDRPDTPAIPETTKELENQGFGWIDTHNMLHARLFAPDYLRLMAGFFVSLRQRHFWFALYLFHFEIRRALYLSLYKRFNVRLLFQHQEASWLQEAQKQAIESAGGIMVGLHWSNYPNSRLSHPSDASACNARMGRCASRISPDQRQYLFTYNPVRTLGGRVGGQTRRYNSAPQRQFYPSNF